jgi:UDP:flavonoid glycosyltransferase YjiC (YdhE family)
MAKLLFFNIPAYGHVNPTLPVVTELVKRGHQVVYYDADTLNRRSQEPGPSFVRIPTRVRLKLSWLNV